MGKIVKIRWKKIKGWPYKVSRYGEIMNRYGKILKASPNGDGYLTIHLSNKGFTKTFYVHSLVAKAFLGSCPQGKETNYKDGIKANNEWFNLEYLTHLENREHAARNGLTNAKLIKKKILLIRRFVAFESQEKVGKRFGLMQPYISYIVNKKIWKHV